MKQYDYLIKLLIIGDSGVGKSCLLVRFTDDTFTPNFITTIGIDFKIKTIEIEGKIYKLQIWDTAGQERFRTITTSYYRGAMGVIIIYDVTDEKSFNNIHYWIKNVDKHANINVDKILVGNKCDLVDKRMVDEDRGRELSERYGVKFYETSAKNCINIDEIFIEILNLVKTRLIDSKLSNNDTFTVEPPIIIQPFEKEKKCCHS